MVSQMAKRISGPCRITLRLTSNDCDALGSYSEDSQRHEKQTPNPLASNGALWGSKIKILTKNDFKSFSKIKASDIPDEFLGYFSLLTSYCVLADSGVPKEGPKHLLPIMPRTD